MKIIKFQDVTIQVEDNSLLSTHYVALGYGVSDATIRRHLQLHNDELVENIHYIIMKSEKGTKKLMWTLEGVHMLGFFIKSERAKEFRKFTAKLLTEIKKGNVQVSVAPPTNCPASDNMSTRISGYKGIIARKNKEIERLRWQLALCKEEQKLNPALHNEILDLAGSFGRLKAELKGRAETLRFIASEFDERIKNVDIFLERIYKLLPTAKDIATKSQKDKEKQIKWDNSILKYN
ncbi:hypothetical protein NrS5_15 [Nitratiruptor phage NrS-5]|uniref:hypothetical protein n=1 Tax=unclassified Nitratiruptor TaxID=2624044 RepID=UPI00191697FC|nr:MULTISPECIES: hypothetical protein [unclassified Nitratiruptor]BCD61719.1 hypothetical protein NitYY0813_C0579 [Nitratiruptor sp. YY08-13]BCD65654.1 hypothetical protein NitYY0826_C0581 [Nitratiruptor sp. YY08-26]BCD83197.1 hypothetical protein NrS4_15 [Nitratiruptor phage NrS-4]BCD83256.1 hypothetical protein NrS5_15 [Nitratiruptor phage NrS-5]